MSRRHRISLWGDLLKTMRSSELFSVTGLPDVGVRKVAAEETGGHQRYEVELRGLDVFDPVHVRNASSYGRRCTGVVPRHRVERPLLPRLAGVLPAYRRMGEPATLS
jgi:hypothetical protein